MIPDTHRRIELLRLRSVQFPPSPIVCIEGPLAQKGSGKGRKGAVDMVRQIEENLSGFQWTVPPRAKMEIEFHFSSDHIQAPALHNLVKYYMDLLKGLAFRDDRQVHYLEAFRSVHRKAATKVFICFDRLSRRNQRLALYNRHKDISIDWSDPSADIWLDPSGIPSHILQYSILSHSALGEWQMAGDPGVYRDYVRMIQASDPFTVFLGDLPRHDEKEEYKTRIRGAFQRFARKYPRLQKLTWPIEVDIQVTPAGLRLGKDLDNIAQDVCPILIEELLCRNDLLSAFRVYVVDQVPGDEGGGIWVKILPAGSILEQGVRIRTVIEEATEKFSSDEPW